ncbi:MAG: HIT family protein [Leptospirales bacterium]
MTSGCAVCVIVESDQSGLMVYRNSSVVLYHVQDVDLPGYLILSLVRHAESLASLTMEEVFSLAMVQQTAVKFLQELPDVRKVYLSSFGEVCPHLHVHLFPRTEEMLRNAASWTDGLPDGPVIFDLYRKKLKTNGISGEVQATIQALRVRFEEECGRSS